MILTNKFTVDYNLELIDRDFDIYAVEKPDYFDKTNILDLATEQFRARALQYIWGRTALVLFDKNNISENKFKEAIEKEYTGAKVRKLDILNEEIRRNNFYYQNRALFQLLANSMRIPRMEGFTYNNLSGKLFYGDPSWISRDRKTKRIYSMYFLQISFEPGMYLNLEVKTFRTNVYSKTGRYYLIDPATGCFRRKLREDDVCRDELFAEASFEKSHNTVGYLDFGSFEMFRKSKLGIMEQFLQDVKKYLGQYLTCTPVEKSGGRCYKETGKEKQAFSGIDYSAVLAKKGVNIVDVCRTEMSERLVDRLVSELHYHYGITAKLGKIDDSMYNIRVIHSPEYYEENKLPDPHSDDLHGCVVQHMIVEEHEKLIESPAEKPSPVLRKILSELILKGDVRSGEVTIYNWPKLCSDKTWTFVLRRTLKATAGGFPLIENAAGRKLKQRFVYTTVTISSDGKMRFGAFDDTEMPADEFEERIRYVFEVYEAEQSRVDKHVEALVFSDIHNIQVIIRTQERTIPNTSAIWKCLKETNVKDAIIRDVVLDALHSYKEFCPADTSYTEQMEKIIQQQKPVFTKGELKKLMNMRTKAGKRLNRFMHQEYGIWVSPEIKDSDFEDEYLLNNMTDIKYYFDENTDGKNITSLNYYVGPIKSSLQLSIHKACIIRQVQAEQKIEFEELMPLMAVEFVKIGGYTVLPFPVKYLREWGER